MCALYHRHKEKHRQQFYKNADVTQICHVGIADSNICEFLPSTDHLKVFNVTASAYRQKKTETEVL